MKVVFKPDTQKTCRKCGVSNIEAKFYANRKICAECHNSSKRKPKKITSEVEKVDTNYLNFQNCKTHEELENVKQALEQEYQERKAIIDNEKVTEFDVIDRDLQTATVKSKLMMYLVQALKYEPNENSDNDVKILELEGDPYNRIWTRIKFVTVKNFTVRHKIEFVNSLHQVIPVAKTNEIEIPFTESILVEMAKKMLLALLSELHATFDPEFLSTETQKNKTIIKWDPEYSIRKTRAACLQEDIINEIIEFC
jgi:hypothetical protein